MYRDGAAQPVRTALARSTEVDGVRHLTVLISNGLFECDLPEFEDPARVEQTLQSVLTASCREGAQHLNLQLWRDVGGEDWTGQYEGFAQAGPDLLDGTTHRVADAAFFAVQEAFLAESIGADRVLAALEDELIMPAGAGAHVRIDRSGSRLGGVASVPEANLEVFFEARFCDEDASLFPLLEASPAFVCP